MNDRTKGPEVGAQAPDFSIASAAGMSSVHELAARHGKLVLTSQDSYRYHPS